MLNSSSSSVYGKLFLDPILRENGEFLIGEEGNPFARTGCRTRTLSPTMCDGTCGNCKKERADFKASWIARLKFDDIRNPEVGAGIEEMPFPTQKDYEASVERKILAFSELKARVIEARKNLHMKADQRVAELLEKSKQSGTN